MNGRDLHFAVDLLTVAQQPGGRAIEDIADFMGKKSPNANEIEKFLSPLIKEQLRFYLKKYQKSDSFYEASWFHSDAGVCGFVFATKDEFFVGFTGTHELKNYLDNGKFWMNFELTPYHFHHGFYAETFKPFQSKFKEILDKYYKTSMRVTFVGHSLGGALAQMTAYFWRDVFFSSPQKQIITFAAPAFGNEVVVQNFPLFFENMRVWRADDMVPVVLDGEHGNLWDWNDRYLQAGFSLKLKVWDDSLNRVELMEGGKVEDEDRLKALLGNWPARHDWKGYQKIILNNVHKNRKFF